MGEVDAARLSRVWNASLRDRPAGQSVRVVRFVSRHTASREICDVIVIGKSEIEGRFFPVAHQECPPKHPRKRIRPPGKESP